jgi:hypothetical protein
MVAPQQLEEQIFFVAEIRVERAVRVARCRRDLLDAGGAQALFSDQLLRGVQQLLPGFIATGFPGEAFAAHGPC